MMFNISEVFNTIQGEGRNAGRPCVFLRFAGCNLWATKEIKSKTCEFCDTPQLHDSTPMMEEEVKDLIQTLMPHDSAGLVITGGEPLLQLTPDFLEWAAKEFDWIDIETNGTKKLDDFDSIRFYYTAEGICDITFSCSPKTDKFILDADQYKILIPDKRQYIAEALRLVGPANTFLQPVEPQAGLESEEYKKNLQETIDVANFTGARVCIQQHKYLQVK